MGEYQPGGYLGEIDQWLGTPEEMVRLAMGPTTRTDVELKEEQRRQVAAHLTEKYAELVDLASGDWSDNRPAGDIKPSRNRMRQLKSEIDGMRELARLLDLDPGGDEDRPVFDLGIS